MNAPGTNMISFVLKYTDATKSTIPSARAKNATVNANNTSNYILIKLIKVVQQQDFTVNT